jgi:hypothetical protein
VTETRHATLEEIEQMHQERKLHYDPNAPEGEYLGDDFWTNAQTVYPEDWPEPTPSDAKQNI